MNMESVNISKIGWELLEKGMDLFLIFTERIWSLTLKYDGLVKRLASQ